MKIYRSRIVVLALIAGLGLASCSQATTSTATDNSVKAPVTNPDAVWEGFETAGLVMQNSSSQSWADLGSSWGGSAAVISQSTLNTTEGTKSLAIPVDITVDSAKNNQINIGSSWGSGVFPATFTKISSIRKISFKYFWVPNAAGTTTTDKSLKVGTYLQGWSNSIGTAGANGAWSGSSDALVENTAATGTITLAGSGTTTLANLDYQIAQVALQINWSGDKAVDNGKVFKGTLYLDDIEWLDSTGTALSMKK